MVWCEGKLSGVRYLYAAVFAGMSIGYIRIKKTKSGTG